MMTHMGSQKSVDGPSFKDQMRDAGSNNSASKPSSTIPMVQAHFVGQNHHHQPSPQDSRSVLLASRRQAEVLELRDLGFQSTVASDSRSLLAPDNEIMARILLETINALESPSKTVLLDVAVNGKKLKRPQYAENCGPEIVEERLQQHKMQLGSNYSRQAYEIVLYELKESGLIVMSTKEGYIGGKLRNWAVHQLSAKGREELSQETSTGEDGEWAAYLESLRNYGRLTDHLEELWTILNNWRDNTAILMDVQPDCVLSDQTMETIAFAAASSRICLMDLTLVQLGVGQVNRGNLLQSLSTWHRSYFYPTIDLGPKMILSALVPTETWSHASSAGVPSWEKSYVRFTNGESPQWIALSEDTQPIQEATVIKHILEALTNGRKVNDASQLTAYIPTPNKQEWEQLVKAEASTGIDVKTLKNILASELLRPILGDMVYKAPSNRSHEEQIEFSRWCGFVDWYMALRRTGIKPCFQDDDLSAKFNRVSLEL